VTYNRNLTALHQGLTPIHSDQDRANFAPKLAGGIDLLLEDGVSYLTFNNVNKKYLISSNPDVYEYSENYMSDLDGTIWTISDIQGWWNLTSSDTPNIERGFGDGSYDVTGRLLSRDLTLTGSVLITDSSPSAIATKSRLVREKILDSFNLVKRGTWLIVDEDGVYKRACYVRLSGQPEISTVNSRGRIDFSIGLRAPNPTKYEWYPVSSGGEIPIGFPDSDGNAYRAKKTVGGISYYRDYSLYGITRQTGASGSRVDVSEYYRNYSNYGGTGEVNVTGYYRNYPNTSTDATSSGTFSIYNYGNTNVYCHIRFVGPLYGPAVIKNTTTSQEINILKGANTSNQVLYPSATVSLEQYLDIDTYSREVHIGDAFNGLYSSSSRGLLSPLVDWIYLQPGENDFYYEDKGASSTNGTIEVYWRSGWDR
jgi:hypothetical protein